MRPTLAAYPATRLRRTRATPAIRGLVRENALCVEDFIWPVFVRSGDGIEEPVPSMPGVYRRSVDKIVDAAREAADLGIQAMCIFPYTGIEERTEDCEGAWAADNHANRAIRAIRAAVPDMCIMTDVALDTYNINGHDGFVEGGEIVNDRTVAALVKMALAQAEAGADIIGPSDMMDGRIGAIRTALEGAGHQNVMILSYAAKYASAFYGPFRDAVGASGALTVTRKPTRWTPPIPTRRCASSNATSPKGPTWSWSNPDSRTSTSAAGSKTPLARRPSSTRCRANTAWCRPPRPKAGSTTTA